MKLGRYIAVFWLFVTFLTPLGLLRAETLLSATVEHQLNVCESLLADGERSTKKEARAQFTKTLNDLESRAWDRIKSAIKIELRNFRNLPSSEKAIYLKNIGSEVQTRIAQETGSEQLGAHFNLHGGQRDDYLVGGGIEAHMGDSGVNYGASKDFNRKVYFFRMKEKSLSEILGTRNPNVLFFKNRMGTALVLFKLDHSILQNYRTEKMITRDAPTFMDFDETRVRMNAKFFGVPRQTYVMPPVRIFTDTAKQIDERRLSWDEETLATMRFLESYIVDTPE